MTFENKAVFSSKKVSGEITDGIHVFTLAQKVIRYTHHLHRGVSSLHKSDTERI